MKFYMFGLFICLTLVCSCNNTDPIDNCTAGWVLTNEIQDEANALSAAASAYGQDPSMANCQAYKSAYLDYLDAARDFEDCARRAGQLAEFNAALDDAEQAVNDLLC